MSETGKGLLVFFGVLLGAPLLFALVVFPLGCLLAPVWWRLWECYEGFLEAASERGRRWFGG